jgi:hypothetical protein
MKTMTRVSATSDAQVRASQETGAGFEYEGIRLDGPEEKLIPLVDAILFYCRVARLRTRPVRIIEDEGCIKIMWSNYAPRAFQSRILNLVGNGRFIDTLTVQESIAAPAA